MCSHNWAVFCGWLLLFDGVSHLDIPYRDLSSVTETIGTRVWNGMDLDRSHYNL